MKKALGPVPIGNVVAEYKFGNTRVLICDDYCRNKTKEEVDAIMDRVAARALLAFNAAARQKGIDS